MARASTFTSYINAELPSDVDSKWRRYEQIATRTYSNIARSAAAANREVAGLQGGRGTAGAGLTSQRQNRAYAEQARQARAIDRVNRDLERSSARVARSFDAQGAAMRRTAKDSNSLSRGLSAVSTSLNIVQGPLGPLAGRVSAVSRAIQELTGFRLGLAGIASSLFIIGSVGNSYQELNGRLRGAFETQSQVNRALSDISGIAARARTALDPIAETYVKITKSAEAYNIAQDRAARLTETVTKAAVLSGGSRQTQEAGLTQFAQGFASGNLAGDELKSVRENTFVLAQAIAKGLGVQVGQLKELAAEGKLTSEVLVEALEKAAFEIDARFSRLPKTIGQARTELVNSFTLIVGKFDELTQFSGRLAGFISALAGALPLLASAAVGVGVAFASIKLAGYVQSITSAVRQTRVMGAALSQLAQRRVAAAQAEVASAQRSKAALDAQQAEIRELIVLEERRRRLATTDLARVRSDPTVTSAKVKAAIREEIAAMQALNAARQNGKITAEALAATEQRLALATKKVEQAQATAAARSRSFATAVRSLIGAINPLGIAIGVVTTALIAWVTRADAAQDTLREFGDEAVSAARKAIGLAEANGKLAESFYDVARARGRLAVSEAREKQAEVGDQLTRRLSIIQNRLRSQQSNTGDLTERARLGLDIERLGKWIDLVDKGTANIGQLNRELQKLQRTTPDAFGGDGKLLGIQIGEATRASDIEDSLAAFTIRRDEIRKALEDEKEIEKLIEESRQRTTVPGATADPVSASSLRTKAQADALDVGTSQIRAAGIRRKQALDELDRELGVSKGKVPGASAEEYRRRAAEIERTYNTEVEGARAAAKARTAAARETAAAARQEIKDERELLGLQLQRDLLALEQRKPGLDEEAYYNERIKLLETYDREIEAIDQASEHSSKSLAQQIRDTRELQRLGESRRERRTDILGRYADQPRAVTRALDDIEDLDRLVGKLIADATGRLQLYTQEQADKDKAAITEGVLKPLSDARESFEKFREVASLRLQGFDLLADSLEEALGLQDQLGALTRDQFVEIVNRREEEQRINSVLAQRERLIEPHLEQARALRTEFEQLLIDLPRKGIGSVGDFFKSVRENANRIWARQVSEALFGNAEQKVRELLGGSKTGLDQAYEFLARHAKDTGLDFDRVGTSADGAADALDRLADAANGAADGQIGGVGGSPSNTVAAAINAGALPPVGGLAGVVAQVAINAIRNGPPSDQQGVVQPDGTIVVTGQRTTQRAPQSQSLNLQIADTIGGALNKVFGTQFFDKLGGIFEGAAVGGGIASLAGGLLGLKTSNTGALVGSAIGSVIPGVGTVLGGAIGSIAGGLFKSTKRGSAILNGGGVTGYYGNSSSRKSQAGDLGGAVIDYLNQIAEAIGATVDASRGKVSIGIRNDDIRVDPQGRGYTKLSTGAVDFGQDQQAAIEYAVRDLIQDGVLGGISAASQRILRAGKDLQKALEKVVAIESIPKQLKQLKDPVGFAIDELNAEFVKLISYLKEGGATAEQFAQAEELYLLRREEVFKQATDGALDRITEFMQELTSGPNSPLNRRTVYQNAQGDLATFREKIAAGETIDQDAFLRAVENFNQASRALYGSSEDYFNDFNDIYALLEKARDNLASGQTGTNPDNAGPSPFESDPTVRALIDQFNGVTPAIDEQTGVLRDLLIQIRDGIYQGPLYGGTGGSSIGALPGFGGGRFGEFVNVDLR